MAVSVKTGTFQKSTNTSTPVDQSITGVGFTPKVLIILSINSTTQDSYVDDIEQVIGFQAQVGAGGASMTFTDEDAVSASDSSSGVINRLFDLRDIDDTLDARAYVKSYDADGFTLTYENNDSNAVDISYMAIGGSDITDAEHGIFTLDTSTGSQSVSALSNADFCMIICTRNAVNGHLGDMGCSLGFATSSTARWSSWWGAHNGDTTTDTAKIASASHIIQIYNPDGQGADALVDFDGFTGSGFDLDISDAPAAGYFCKYLLIKGGQWQVGNGTGKSSTGTKAYTTSFEPVGLFSNIISDTSLDNMTAHSRVCFGFSDGEAGRAISHHSTDGGGTSDTHQIHESDEIQSLSHAGKSLLVESHVDSFNATDFTLDYTNDATYVFGWFVVGSEEAGTTPVSKSTIFKHNIIEAISKTQILKHNIQSAVSKSSILKHNIQAAVSKTQILKHNIIEAIPKQTIFKHNLAGSVSKSSILKHQIIQAIPKSTILKHQIIEAISKSTIFKHNIAAGPATVSKSTVFRHHVNPKILDGVKAVAAVRGTDAVSMTRGTDAVLISGQSS